MNERLLKSIDLFNGLELSDEIAKARIELSDHLKAKGYKTKINHLTVDVVATRDNEKIAVLIGRHSIRYKRVGQLMKVKDHELYYLLRGNARADWAMRGTVNILSIKSKGSL